MREKKFHLYCFLKFIVIKTPDPDRDSLEMLGPDPYPDPDSMNPDPQHCLKARYFYHRLPSTSRLCPISVLQSTKNESRNA